jgi:hypothetical protein
MTKSSGFRYFLCLMAVVAIIAATFAVATGDILGSILAAIQLAISPALIVIALLAAIPYYFLFVRKEQVAKATFPKMGEPVRRAPTVDGDLVNYTLTQTPHGTITPVPTDNYLRTTKEHRQQQVLALRKRGYQLEEPRQPKFVPRR